LATAVSCDPLLQIADPRRRLFGFGVSDRATAHAMGLGDVAT
jgi:hypothetical protein